MLSIFPTLLAYGLFGTTFLRISLGVIFIWLGLRALSTERKELLSQLTHLGFLPARFSLTLLSTLELLGGLFVALGLYTQVGALLIALISAKIVFWSMLNKPISKEPAVFYVMAFVMAITILFIGPGIFAFDLPL